MSSTNMAKILLIYPYIYISGGVERHLLEFADFLTKQGHEIFYLFIKPDERMYNLAPPEGISKDDYTFDNVITQLRKGVLSSDVRSAFRLMVYTLPINRRPISAFILSIKKLRIDTIMTSFLLSLGIKHILSKYKIDVIYAAESIPIISSCIVSEVWGVRPQIMIA